MEKNMSKTYEVMTYALATCGPEESVAHVVEIMRNRDIGNVLIVDEDKLVGIVTDRDLALGALTGKDDPLLTPIRKFMSTEVVTAEADSNLEQVADIMTKHQVRRVPIVQNGQLVGIVSLGDLSRFEERKEVVTKSLEAVSTPTGLSQIKHSSRGGALVGFTLIAMTATLVAWLTWNQKGQEIRKQMAKSEFYHTAQRAVNTAMDKVEKASSSKSAEEIRHQMQVILKELSAQLPSLEYKSPKHKNILFG
jgi:CBS domain-containing protein